MQILVIGAGDHGQVVADILLRMAEAGADLSVAGFLDDNPAVVGRRFLGISVLGCLADRVHLPHDAVVVAVGNNRTRQRVSQQLASQGERFAIACHPRTIIAPDVLIGQGCMVSAGVAITPSSVIGEHVILNTGCIIDHHNKIGDYVHIAPGVHLGGSVQIGTGALVGIGATVMPRRSVGDWAVIGAGAVVTRDIPPGATAIGIPARPRGTMKGPLAPESADTELS